MTNRWWKIEIHCAPEQEESVFYRLEGLGCRGTATEVKDRLCLIRAYLPESETQVADLEALAKRLHEDALALELSSAKAEWHLIDEEDWASSWKQYWQPTPVGDRFLVCPAWRSPSPQESRIVIRLDPGAAFGTGTHPTTQLCLKALESCLASYPNLTAIADIGCGSGILSIGAILAGVEQGYAVDLDSLAVSAACSNRQLNQIEPDQLAVAQGSVEQVQQMVEAGVDGILCNILAEVIIQLIPHLEAIAKPNTWGILSGILNKQAAAVTDTLEQHSWMVVKTWQQQEWCALEIGRNCELARL